MATSCPVHITFHEYPSTARACARTFSACRTSPHHKLHSRSIQRRAFHFTLRYAPKIHAPTAAVLGWHVARPGRSKINIWRSHRQKIQIFGENVWIAVLERESFKLPTVSLLFTLLMILAGGRQTRLFQIISTASPRLLGVGILCDHAACFWCANVCTPSCSWSLLFFSVQPSRKIMGRTACEPNDAGLSSWPCSPHISKLSLSNDPHPAQDVTHSPKTVGGTKS
jgi:hypothetical protein